jgi:hypothetical protein
MEQALQLFLGQIPATGEVDYEVVDNALRITPEGRAARPYFHKLRRSGAIAVRINKENGHLMVSRPAATPAAPVAPVAPSGGVG